MLLGIDIGTSSVKVSAVDPETRQCIASASYPDTEAGIIAPQTGWAEQSPEDWWKFTKQAITRLKASGRIGMQQITAIGIAYQMHGLVLVDKNQQVLRNSIIWCDSRAVSYGELAFAKIGKTECLSSLLNSPGNFTAAKLAWVKHNEPEVYKRVHKVLLPGDFIAMKLTAEVSTTSSALSEGIFWDFKEHGISAAVIDHFGFDYSFFPQIKAVFGIHGTVSTATAEELGLPKGIPVSYKAGDQPNNALSLNVLKPGEVAANAGTSGVIYGVSGQLLFDPETRINSFAHVNHHPEEPSIGVLLCINGAGITSKWIRSLSGQLTSYEKLNQLAADIPAGCEGLSLLPFGNGAERMLKNIFPGAGFNGLDFNKHTQAHLYRAGLEGVAFAFRYGLDIMRQNGIQPAVFRAGNANMFLSEVFTEAFVNATGVPLELYNNDGSCGAALGAGIGAGNFSLQEAFQNFRPIKRVEVSNARVYNELYGQWRQALERKLNNIHN